MAAQAAVRKKSNTAKVVLRITGAVMQVLLNVVFYVLVVIFIIKAANFSYDFAYTVFGDVALEETPGKDIEIQILKGDSTMNVASKLELNNVIVDKYSFYLKAKLKKSEIMPGIFLVNSSMNYNEIIAVITDYSKAIIRDETTEEQKESVP